MSCIYSQDSERMERYLRGELEQAEQERLERHFFECDECFTRLETLRAARTALAERREEIEASGESRFDPRRWKIAAGLFLAVLAVGALWWIQPRPPAQLIMLSRIQPPVYEPVRLRGVEDDAASLFSEAMEAYLARDFPSAVTGLERAQAADPASPKINFYLGASYLLVNRPEEAIPTFQTVVDAGDGPYLEEAHWLLAKSHMRAGNREAAREALEKLIELRGDFESDARALRGELLVLP